MENPTPTSFDLHLKTWGFDPESFIARRHRSQAIDIWIIKAAVDHGPSDFVCDGLYNLLHCFQPDQGKDNPLNLAIYESFDKYGRDIRLSGKPGRVIKRLLPFADETLCTKFAEWFKETYTELTYTIKESFDGKDFALAYSGAQSKTANPYLSYNQTFQLYAKSLQSSCMRHDKSDFRGGLPIHPSEVYASGDFKIVWAEDSKGYIAARCVVNVKQGEANVYAPGPIYTATDSAFHLLAEYLVSQGYDKKAVCDDTGWKGARLRAVEYQGGYIAPYMDLCSNLELLPCGEFFKVSRRGDFAFRETGGTVDSECFCCHCEDCGEGIREDDDHYYTSDGETVCQDCYSNGYFTCNGNGEVYRRGDETEVYSFRFGRVRSTGYSTEYVQDSGDIVYCDNSDEYWQMDDTTYIESESVYVPTHDIDQFYFMSDNDSEWYSIDQKVYIDCLKENWTLDQIEDSDQFDIVKGDIGSVTVTLKAHLEINDCGSIVDNQMSLNLAA